LFTSVNFVDQPVAGRQPDQDVVTLTVAEDRADMPVRIDIPGLNEEQLWRELRSAEPLIDRVMPHNDRAAQFYCDRLEAVLKNAGHEQKLTAVQAADLQTGKMELSLMPANPPSVSNVRFEGTRAFSGDLLAGIVGRLAIGKRYSAREFGQILSLNVRPLYEEWGYLRLEFGEPRLVFGRDTVAVTVPVKEGELWTLGTVEIAGESRLSAEMERAARFAEGKTANWKRFLESLAAAEKVLAANGYLAASCKPVRHFRDDGRTVDVRVDVTPGRQYRFGALDTSRLGEFEPDCRSRWKLATGDPFNKPYTEQVWRGMLDEKIKVRMQYQVRPDGTTIDVIYSLVPPG
jgi:hypothetical protein